MSPTKTIVFISAVIVALLIGWSSLLPPAIYSSAGWFALWVIIGIVVTFGIIKSRLWKNLPLFALHLSLLLMIVGGILTSTTSKHGTLYLFPSLTTDSFISENGKIERLPAPVTLLSFRTEYYPDLNAPKDYRSEVLIASSDTMHISMNHIGRYKNYRFYQNSYDEEGASILSVTYDPIGIPIVYAGFLLFAIGGLVYLIRNYLRLSLISLALLAVAYISLIVWLKMKNSGTDPVLPVLDSPWLSIHVSLVMVSYILLGITMPLALTGLLMPKKRERLMSTTMSIVAPGTYLLGLGIIAGAMWANVSWGRYWAWDPKETWALVTMLLYCLPMHRYFGLRKHPIATDIYLVFIFLSIIMTYLGVNYLPSLHAYN